MPNTVLVLPAGQTATVVIKSLRKDSSLRIIAADINFLAPGLHLADKGYLVPPVSDPSFYEKIRDIISKESVDVIFPNGNFFTYVLANLAERLSKLGAKVLASEPSTMEKCIDKWKTYEYLHSIIPMPKSTIELDGEHILDDIGLPAFIKPRNGSGSKNVHKAEDLNDLRYYIKKVQNPIVQEFVDGKVYCIDILVNGDSEPLCSFSRKSIDYSDGMPIKAVVEPRNDLIDLANRLSNALKFFGVINMDIIIAKKDLKPKVVDVNPRVGNGVILGVSAGCNLPLNAVYLALEKPLESMHPVPYPLYMTRYHEEIFLDDSLEKISL